MPIVIIIYNILILLLVPFLLPLGYVAAYWKKEEQDYFERFGLIIIPKKYNRKESIWFHCASVGEVRSIKRVLEIIRERFPELGVVVSTITASGKKVANEELRPDVSFLLPIENSYALRYLINILNCKCMFIVDTELWPNLILTASKCTNLYMLNGRISDRSFKRYYFFKMIFGSMLKKFHKIFTKSDVDYKKFVSLTGNNENIYNLGDIKLLNRRKSDLILSESIISKIENKKIFLAASTHEGEESFVLEAYIKNRDAFDLMIVAPRHLNRVDSVVELMKCEGKYNVCKLSEFDNIKQIDIVVVDMFGKLESLYSIAHKIFIGGSIADVGGHNIFEAVQFHKEIAVGTNMYNFQEIYELSLFYNVSKTVTDVDSISNYLIDENKYADFDSFFDDIDKRSKTTIQPIIDEVQKCII